MNKRQIAIVAVLIIGIAGFILWKTYGTPYPSRADIIVFSPHPDDSVLCCAGVIQQALAKHKRVLVVDVTNGDAYPEAAAAIFSKPKTALTPRDMRRLAAVRQREDVYAQRALGLAPQNVIFLSYPDGGLNDLYHTQDQPYLSRYTQKYATYPAARPDYHSSVSPIHALYTKQYAIADINDIIRRAHPSEIYVTGGQDTAPDHFVTYWLVRDAVRESQYSGKLITAVIHAPNWPSPFAVTPGQSFQPVDMAHGLWQSTSLPWPPPIRVPLTPKEVERKRIAATYYRSQELAGELSPLLFVKNEEVFWE